MTTIATDGKTIAADSLTTFGDLRAQRPSDKLKCLHDRIYAVSGVASIDAALIQWHHDGADPYKLPFCPDSIGGWAMLVISAERIHYFCNTAPYPMDVFPPFTLGSGSHVADGAMAAGATPREAVEIACKLLVSSDLPVMELDIAATLAKGEAVHVAPRRPPVPAMGRATANDDRPGAVAHGHAPKFENVDAASNGRYRGLDVAGE